MAFSFHAELVHVDNSCRRLAFADGKDEYGKHYFIMDRSEESPEETMPDMANVYIERDDHGWGGYGGIKRVALERNSLTLYLGERMAVQMGNHESIRVGFDISEAAFKELQHVLGRVMRGYESRLVIGT